MPESLGNLRALRRLVVSSTAITDFPESLRQLQQLEVVRGSLSRDPQSPFGLSQAVKDKLARWLPKTRLEIW
ncbi:MAG: hypothetical protein QM765_46105 [Myxococcales bacterium]